MRISLKHGPGGIDLPRKLEHIDSKVDVVPFITMKYLSQKQVESTDLSEFLKNYGFTFREYELLTNILEQYEENKDSSLSNIKSALNVLKNSENDDIKEIFSRLNEEKITKDILDDIIEILNSEEDLTDLYKHVHYLQIAINDEDSKRIIPPTIDLLSKLAVTHHQSENVYDPTSLDAQTITELDEFDHATVYIKDEEEYYHAKQNLIINDIALDKVALENKNVLIDENDTKYDTIISIPYNKQHRSKSDNIEKYAKYETNKPGHLHLLNLIDHMDDDGVIVTTAPQDLLVKKDAYKIRKTLVEENMIDAVIDYETGFRSRDITVLILNKNKKNDDFLFIKPPEMFPAFLLPAFNENIIEIYEERKIESRLSNIVDKDEIIKNDYNLNPKRYVYTLDYTQTPIEDIIENQKEYLHQITQLDDEIEQMLKEIKE